MKNSLGKIIILLLIISNIYAEDFIYNIKVDNPTPYLKEPIILTLELNQTNPNIVLLFNFELQKSHKYSFQRLNTIEEDTHHNARVKYKYLIYPLESGDIDIRFNLLKRVTNDSSVAYSFSGDRDNVKGLVTKDTKVILPPLKLNIKPLPQNTLLVGDFKLTYSIKYHKAKAYEPLAFQVNIKGNGYPPILNHILPKDANFTKFQEKPIINSHITKHNIKYSMALSHSKDFDLKEINIQAFNPKTQKIYQLKIPKQHFEIEQIDIKNLIDKTNSPKVLKQDFLWLYTLLSYIIIFIAGYITAYTIKWEKKIIKVDNNPLKSKIESCKDEKELLQLLISINSKKYLPFIEELEGNLYRGKRVDLKRLKNKIKLCYNIN